MSEENPPQYNLYQALEEESKSILCPRHAQLCRDARDLLIQKDAATRAAYERGRREGAARAWEQAAEMLNEPMAGDFRARAAGLRARAAEEGRDE